MSGSRRTGRDGRHIARGRSSLDRRSWHHGGHGHHGRHGHNGHHGHRYGGSYLWGGYGGWGWGGYPYGYGTAVLYGYPSYGYYNPYCDAFIDTAVTDVAGAIDYSQPLGVGPIVPLGTDAALPLSQQGAEYLAMAEAAFRNQDYVRAMNDVTQAARQASADHDVHHFRSLVFFAQKDYRQAAAAAYAALSAGPAWDWPTLRGTYLQKEHYTVQLRALETFTYVNSDDASAQFLLAYHYLMLGHEDAARRQLEIAMQLEPTDRLSPRLLKMLSPGASLPSTPPPPPTPDNYYEEKIVPANPPADTGPSFVNPKLSEDAKTPLLPPQTSPEAPIVAPKPPGSSSAANTFGVGTWKATPDAETTIEMTLESDNTFRWSVSTAGEAHSLSGTYVLKAGTLTLTGTKNGQKFAGKVTQKEGKTFHFKLSDTEASDPGLTFSRK